MTAGSFPHLFGRNVLLDVLLDHAGVPEGVDTAWRPKHYLGAPLPGVTRATVNMAHVVAVIEFSAEQNVEGPGEISGSATRAISEIVGELRQAAENAVEGRPAAVSWKVSRCLL